MSLGQLLAFPHSDEGGAQQSPQPRVGVCHWKLSLDLECWSAVIYGVVPPNAERQLFPGKMCLVLTKLLGISGK